MAKSEEFLLAAELMLDEKLFDVATSLAVSAAINASDAIILEKTGSIPSGPDHNQAVIMLRKATDLATARQLQSAIGLKDKAQYRIARCTRADADSAVKAARRLLNKSKGIQ